MKIKALSLVAILLLSTIVLFSTDELEKFKVYGNCGMCEKRIENAAMKIDGITKAVWNSETKMIEVSFDESATNLVNIQMAIASAGHDTETYFAKDVEYETLPGCCKYDRAQDSKTLDGNHNHMNSGCTRTRNNTSKSSCCNKNM